MSELKDFDREVYDAIKGEEERELSKIVLIASENNFKREIGAEPDLIRSDQAVTVITTKAARTAVDDQGSPRGSVASGKVGGRRGVPTLRRKRRQVGRAFPVQESLGWGDAFEGVLVRQVRVSGDGRLEGLN